jgi:DNA-binding response OmpR family regulator
VEDPVTTTTAARERILVIEDEPDIREIMEYNLVREGFRVGTAADGHEGLQRARTEFPDLILLDLMLPRVDGIEVCRQLKGDPDLRAIPVIMVTAKSEGNDVVAGLEAGADDYIVKPFNTKELMARIKAVIRRGQWEAPRQRERVVVQGVVIDSGRHVVIVDGEPANLTATEFRLLHFLSTNPGRVFTRNHLITRVIGGDAVVIDRNIDVHVGSVRKKLGEHRDLIQTVRGVGYRFQEEGLSVRAPGLPGSG